MTKKIIIPDLTPKPPANPNWKEEAMKIKYKAGVFNGCMREQIRLCKEGGETSVVEHNGDR